VGNHDSYSVNVVFGIPAKLDSVSGEYILLVHDLEPLERLELLERAVFSESDAELLND